MTLPEILCMGCVEWVGRVVMMSQKKGKARQGKGKEGNREREREREHRE
jgi:hypothetical protein